MKYLILTLLLLPNLILAQVGIGTTSPQEALHVVGAIRVTNINNNPATAMVGSDNDGTFNEVNIGSNLDLTDGTLHAAGTNKYFIKTLSFPTTTSGQKFHDVYLDLNGANKDMTVFRIKDSSHGFEFTGIAGGF